MGNKEVEREMSFEDDYIKMDLKIKGKNAAHCTEQIMKAIQEAEKEIKKQREKKDE